MSGLWGHANSYFAVFNWVIVCLILLTLAFDLMVHKLGHWLDHKAGAHGEQRLRITNLYAMYSFLLRRYKSELMVLGFLAFFVWICHSAGLYEAIVGGGAEGAEAHRRLGGGAGSAAEHGGEAGEAGEAAFKYAADFYFPGDCELTLMKDPHALGEVVETAHMVLFLTMSLYFLVQVFVIAKVNRSVHSIAQEEKAELSGAPANDAFTRALVVGMRKRLLEHIAESPTGSAELARSPALAAVVEAGKLNMTEFIDRTSEEVVEGFLEFPTQTWLLILPIQLILTLIIQFTCFPAVILPFWVCILSALVALIFLLWHIVQSQRIKAHKGLRVLPCLQRALWPLMLFGVPFSFGYAPWSSKPSDLHAISCVQVHIYAIAQVSMWAWADREASFYYSKLEGPMLGSLTPRAGAAIHGLIFVLCIGVVVWLESSIVIMLAFPPYVTEEEEQIILDVLREYPDGLPADDRRSREQQHEAHTAKTNKVHPEVHGPC